MSKQQAKQLFKDGETKWEEKTMHDFIDVVFDNLNKSAITAFHKSSGSTSLVYDGGGTQIKILNAEVPIATKGDGLTMGGMGIRVRKPGMYLISYQLKLTKNTVPNALVGARVVIKGQQDAWNNFLTWKKCNGDEDEITMIRIAPLNKDDVVTMNVMSSTNQTIEVRDHTSLTVIEI